MTSRGVRLGAATIAAAVAIAAAGCGSEPPRVTPAGDAGAPAGAASDSVSLPVEPNAIATPDDAAKDELVDKTFDDIKFDIEPGDPYDRGMLPDTIHALDGQRMRIRGYILPTARSRGIRQFVLVRDNQECCFGPGAALYDCILVNMQGDATAEFSIRPVAVEGRFVLDEFIGPDDYPLAIYRLDGESVR